MTDSEILCLMQEAPPRGQRELFDKYYSYVYAIVNRLISGFGSISDTEECVIDVFASVMMKLGKDSDISLKSYIGTAARNAAISMRRSIASKRGMDLPDGDESMNSIADEADVAGDAERSELSQQLLSLIGAMGTPDSVIIIQKYYYNRTSAEIARMVDMTPAAVRVRCGRAMKRLKKLLDEKHITL